VLVEQGEIRGAAADGSMNFKERAERHVRSSLAADCSMTLGIRASKRARWPAAAG